MPIRNPTSEQLSLHCVLTHDPDHISDGVWVHRQAHREHKEQDGKSRKLWPRPEQARQYLGERTNVSFYKTSKHFLYNLHFPILLQNQSPAMSEDEGQDSHPVSTKGKNGQLLEKCKEGNKEA